MPPSPSGFAEASLASAYLVESTVWRTTRRPRWFRGRRVVRGLSGGWDEDAVDDVDDAVGRSDVWLDDAGVVHFHGATRHFDPHRGALEGGDRAAPADLRGGHLALRHVVEEDGLELGRVSCQRRQRLLRDLGEGG